MNYLLNIVIFFPAFAALLLYVLKGENSRIFAILVGILELLFVALLWNEFNVNYGGIQLSTHYELISSYNISYFVGIDGISLFLLTLNAFITLLTLYFFKYLRTPLIIAILFLESIVMGVFSALDVMMFYIFWELSLLPVLYIIGVWGGERRIYASIKYFLYTFGASLVMLVGILYFAYQYFLIMGAWSFNLIDWYQISLDIDTQKWLFVAFFIGMAVKIPIFPLHSWQPHAYTQAPLVGSVLLSAVLSKMGTYGLLRLVLPLFPFTSSNISLFIGLVCVFMVVYGAFIALAQTNLKTFLAYSSLSHMGIIVLGIFSLNTEGLSGAVFFMVAHGVVVGALFMLVGVLQTRTQTQDLQDVQGLAHSMPKYSSVFGIVMMCSLGLPLTMGFVGEVLSLYGFFQVNPIIAFLAGSSFFVGAIYMLTMFRKVFFGSALPKYTTLKDLNLREKIVFIPILVIIIWLGVYPKPLLTPISTSAETLSQVIAAKIQLTNPATDNTMDNAEEKLEYPLGNIPQDFNDDGVLFIPRIGE